MINGSKVQMLRFQGFKSLIVQGFNCLRRLRFKGSPALAGSRSEVQMFNCSRVLMPAASGIYENLAKLIAPTFKSLVIEHPLPRPEGRGRQQKSFASKISANHQNVQNNM